MLNAALYLQGPNIWSALALFASTVMHAYSYTLPVLPVWGNAAGVNAN